MMKAKNNLHGVNVKDIRLASYEELQNEIEARKQAINDVMGGIGEEMDKKADKQTKEGGFCGGYNAAVTPHGYNSGGGAAVGAGAETENGISGGVLAKSTTGAALGAGASTETGIAGGHNARSTVGAALGQTASANGGAAVGWKTVSTDGGAVGAQAVTQNGGAIGMNAWSLDGAAIGKNTRGQNGVAVGKDAKVGRLDGTAIDAVQIGEGINIEPKTVRMYGYKLMNEDGTIPIERIPEIQNILSAYADIMNSGVNHRNIYRGKSLGTVITDEQKQAISSGSFEDLFIGDYWTLNGTRYVITDMDYWLNVGDVPFTKHHLVMTPHASPYSAKMNDTNTTDGGYISSKMYTEYIRNAKTLIRNAFGNMLLTHRDYFSFAVADGNVLNGAWVDSTVDLMSEVMVYGTRIRSVEQGIATADKMQLALFRLNPEAINNGIAIWLRDVVSAAGFALVDSNGYAYAGGSSTSLGVRPVFAIG